MTVLDSPRLRTDDNAVADTTRWQPYENALFRFVFLYFGIQLLPIDGRFFQNLLDTNGGYSRYVFNLSRYAPHFFVIQDTFLNWLVVAIIAVVGAVIWTVRTKATTNYTRLYYWLRVALRYRLAIGLIAYGFIKLFP